MTPEQAAQFLGVSMNITESDLKKQYRYLCKKWHPDLNHNDEKHATQMMQKINCAYRVMSNFLEQKRSKSNGSTHSNKQSSNQQNNARQKQSATKTPYSCRVYNVNGYVIHEYTVYVNGNGVFNTYNKILNDFMKAEFDFLQTLIDSISR